MKIQIDSDCSEVLNVSASKYTHVCVCIHTCAFIYICVCVYINIYVYVTQRERRKEDER